MNTLVQGEVTIREALQELVAWAQTAEVKLTEHEQDGRQTPLIRDWKDLFLELGDKQSLLASLKESQVRMPVTFESYTQPTEVTAVAVKRCIAM
jgi:dynein heavy chain 2, cytosolic